MHDLAPERTQLLPAGILVLGAAAERLGRPLRIGRGGLREGVILELAATTLSPWPRPRTSTSRPTSPTARAGARIVRVRARELFEHAEGVLDTRDIERVHDMRVASRRLRAVLEIFAPVLPAERVQGRAAATSSSSPTRSASGATPTCTSTRCTRSSRALHAGEQARRRRAWSRTCASARRAATRCSPPSSSASSERGLHGRLLALADAADGDEDGDPGGGGAVKARKVDGLDPDGALADNAERIVRVRLDELCGFMPQAADPERGRRAARHADRRQAAALHPRGHRPRASGPYARTATKLAKDLQDLLGEIHDCDVQIPETAAFAERLLAADAARCTRPPATAPDLDPALLKQAPHARDHAGVAALQAHLRARRALLFDRFLELWGDLRAQGLPRAARVRGR